MGLMLAESPHDFTRTKEDFACLDRIARHGGPKEDEFDDLLSLFGRLAPYRAVLTEQIQTFHDAHAEAFKSLDTLQGHVILRPRGYNGDFEIIDRIYRYDRSTNPRTARWDDFFHWGSASRAVRNRKAYFVRKMRQLELDGARSVLNLGCGPSSDVAEYIMHEGASRLRFTCLDSDMEAIAYSRQAMLQNANVDFVHGNALRLKFKQTFDTVWSAGLFDYLGDTTFVGLLKRVRAVVAKGGSILVGNFGPMNTQRPYMEFGFWDLVHRDPDHLRTLAMRAGFPSEAVSIESEETAANLFLCIKVS